MDESVKIRTLRSIEELQEIRSYWESWRGHRDSDIDIFTTVVRTGSETIRPHVIALYRNGLPDAILIGRIDIGPISNMNLGYLRFTPKARQLYLVYGGLRGHISRDNVELFIREICDTLKRGEAEAAYFNYLRDDSFLFRMAKEYPSFFCRDRTETTLEHFSVVLPPTGDQFKRSLSRRLKRNKERWKKMLREHPGAVEIKTFHSIDDVTNLVNDLEQVASGTYQRKLGFGFMNTPQHVELLRTHALKEWLRAYILYIEERPCAFWVGYVNNEKFYGDYVGYLPDVAKYSPGLFLMVKLMEEFCGNGIKEIDFGRGAAQYKSTLSNKSYQEKCVYIFGPSLKMVCLNLLRTVVSKINILSIRFLQKTGLLDKVKRLWRSHLSHTDKRKHGEQAAVGTIREKLSTSARKSS